MLRYFDDDRPLRRYLELKAEIKRLEEELKELQPLLLAALFEEPSQQATYEGYQLSIGTRRTFRYSADVETLQAELKNRKKAEEQDGTAVVVRHTSFLITRDVQ